MNIFVWLIVGVMCILGGSSTIYVIVSLFYTIGNKIYRKVKYNEPMM